MNVINSWPNLSRAYQIAKLGGLSIKIVHERTYDARADYQAIKEFYCDIKFAKDGEIVLQLENTFDSRSEETLFDLHFQIETAKMERKPDPYIKGASQLLLENAVTRLGFDQVTKDKAGYIAQIIAWLSGYDAIRPDSMAEAILYCQYPLDPYVVAEDNSLSFGKGINIFEFDHERLYIKDAIAYLQSLLPNENYTL